MIVNGQKSSELANENVNLSGTHSHTRTYIALTIACGSRRPLPAKSWKSSKTVNKQAGKKGQAPGSPQSSSASAADGSYTDSIFYLTFRTTYQALDIHSTLVSAPLIGCGCASYIEWGMRELDSTGHGACGCSEHIEGASAVQRFN